VDGEQTTRGETTDTVEEGSAKRKQKEGTTHGMAARAKASESESGERFDLALVGSARASLCALKEPQSAATPPLRRPPAENGEQAKAVLGPPKARRPEPANRPAAAIQRSRLGLPYI
jgi:hypothetical protein